MSVRQHRQSRSDALRAAIASVRPADSPFGSDASRRRAVRYVDDQSWRRRASPAAPAPSVRVPASSVRAPAPVAYGHFEAASWDASAPVEWPQIKLRSHWSDFLPRPVRYGRGRRYFTIASALAAIVLTAACASSVKLSQESLRTPVAESQPLPAWSPSRRIRTAAAERDESPSLGRAPFRGAPALVEDFPQIRTADVEEPATEAPAPAPPLLRRPSPLGQPLTKLVAFASSPFPYNGTKPGGGPFIDYAVDGQRGHRTRRGILWEAKTFSDNRSLLHIPAGFDPDRPAAIVVFFHGYGATLSRDIGARQQVPQQISASGANVVLAAPQFAFDARDSSIGKFWQPGGFRRYLAEAARDFAKLQGDPSAEQTFNDMPVIIVGYSGGFLPAAFAIKDLEGTHRTRGVLMLDAMYGEFERFTDWAATNRSGFFVSAYTHFTQPMNNAVQRMMDARGVIDHGSHLPRDLTGGGATFMLAETPHQDYVTKAWTANPIKDILQRLPDLRARDPQAIASVDPSRVGRSEAAVR